MAVRSTAARAARSPGSAGRLRRAAVLLGRFFRIVWVVMGAVLVYLWRRLGRLRLARPDRERLRGEVLADTLERLGATFVKFGQILSTRPDLLGPGYIAALSRLQDRVPPEPFERIRAVIDQELDGTSLAELERIDEEPVAAASVAQVHRAVTDAGEELALKVQRPDAPAQVDRDLALMAMGARVLEVVPSVKLLSISGAVERFGAAMRGQLDFRLEAENNRRFAAMFAPVEGVEVPGLHDALCTPRVLAMQYVHGVRATEPEKVGGDRTQLARRGLDAILRMVFHDGFVHADLHPGNILLTDDGKVVLIDLGLVAEIPDEMKRPWIETFMALSTQDGPAAARLFYGHAPSVGDTDYAAFEADVIEYFRVIEGKKLGDVEASVVISGMMNVLRRHHVQIDPAFTVVNIAMLVAEGLGKQLDPSLDLVQMAGPHLAMALATAPPARPMLREPPAAL